MRTEEERSRLCLACGLCCEGVLHDLVPLDEDELEHARGPRLPVVETPLRVAFRLPCPRLDERRCTVYAERPRTCASYACGVLRAFTEGAIDDAEALARIEAARREHGRPRGESLLSHLRKTWFDAS